METIIIILGIIIIFLVWIFAVTLRDCDYYKQIVEQQKFDINKLKNKIYQLNKNIRTTIK